MADNSETRVAAVARILGHTCLDETLLLQACTHASRCGAQATAADKLRDANERLEFIGDALLGAALCVLFYQRFPTVDEGQLSRLKAHLASRTVLARVIEQTGLLSHCLVGLQMVVPWPDSVKANLMESILAALYLDGGWSCLLLAVERLFSGRIMAPESGVADARTALQAWCFEHHKRLPVYTSERSGGSDHEPEFLASASIGDISAQGRGSGRRRAESAAAAALLHRLGVSHDPASGRSPAGDGTDAR